jgi:hypothetical protein
MNCFAGLVWKKTSTSDQPKTSNMNTFKTNIRIEQEMIKLFFRELFMIQLELEKYRESGCFHDEITALIQIIDDLLEFLMSKCSN